MTVNYELGLATIGGTMRYVAPGYDALTAASSGKIKLGIYQVNDSGVVSVKYGPEAIPAYAGGVSLSGLNPDGFTPGGTMNVELDGLGTQPITISSQPDGASVAAAIQVAVNTAFSYSGFTATYDFTENPSADPTIGVGSAAQAYVINSGGSAALGLTGVFASLCYAGGLYLFVGDVSTNNRIRKIYAASGFSSGSDLTPSGLNRPYSMAFDGTYIWVGNQDNTIIRMDTSGVAYGSPITLTSGSKITSLLYDGTYMWALCNSNGALSRILASDPGQPIYDLFLGGAPGPGCLAFDGTYIWCATPGGADDLTKVSRGTIVFGPSIYNSSSAMTNVASIAWDSVNGFLWGVDNTENQLYKIAGDLSFTTYQYPWGAEYDSPVSAIFDGTNFVVALAGGGGGVAKISAAGSLVGRVTNLVGTPQVLLSFPQSAARYTLTSGTTGVGSLVHVTTYNLDTMAARLKLGVANGGTEIDGGSSISASYPDPDTNNIILAYLFGSNTVAGVPIDDSTTAVTNDNIGNNVAGR